MRKAAKGELAEAIAGYKPFAAENKGLTGAGIGGLGGLAAGALVGGLTGLMNPDRDEEGRPRRGGLRRFLGGALTGGLGGAALGAGLGYLGRDKLRNFALDKATDKGVDAVKEHLGASPDYDSAGSQMSGAAASAGLLAGSMTPGMGMAAPAGAMVGDAAKTLGGDSRFRSDIRGVIDKHLINDITLKDLYRAVRGDTGAALGSLVSGGAEAVKDESTPRWLKDRLAAAAAEAATENAPDFIREGANALSQTEWGQNFIGGLGT